MTHKTLPKPVSIDSRICFGIYWFLTEDEANIYAAHVRERGDTYNGGWFHGMACGRDKSFDWTLSAESIKRNPEVSNLPVGTTLYAVTVS